MPLSQSTDRETTWMEAAKVRVGDEVLDSHDFHIVTHSKQADNGTWMLRFEYGVRYYNPAAPVAVATDVRA